MQADPKTNAILDEVACGRPLAKPEAELLLAHSAHSIEAALTRAAANALTRRKSGNAALLLGQIGVDMAPCDGDCAFCFFARSHTNIEPCVLAEEEIVARCHKFAAGGAQGVFLMTMHRFGFEWFRDLCASLRRKIAPELEILANVGDVTRAQLEELRDAGVSGAYHVCRLREGTDSCMDPAQRVETIERILAAGLDWYNLCEPIGPEHSAAELAEQMWLGVEVPCRQHGAMQRFPVPGSPLYAHGSVSLARLSQVVAVVALATAHKPETTSVAVNVSNVAGLFSGANAFFPEAGEPDPAPGQPCADADPQGFTTALWRQNNEITTTDCRAMLRAAGFGNLMDAAGNVTRSLNGRSM